MRSENKVRSDSKMYTVTYKMRDLKGVDESQADLLTKAGIETTDDMLKLRNDSARRLWVETLTGLTDEQLTRLESMARMSRFDGIGPKYAALLVTAGVRGRMSLSTYTPGTLVEHLANVIAAKGLRGPTPTLHEVDAWFASLRPRPLKVAAA